ncbi:MAG: Na+/H+ antiporter NhaC family protein [Bradymonadaceae bacterium]
MAEEEGETADSTVGSGRSVHRRTWIGAAIAVVLVLAAVWATGSIPKREAGHYGFWSLVPPLAAIVLAFWLQEVVSALFIGIVLGGVVAGDLNIVQTFLIPAVGTEDFAMILLVYLWALGGLIGMWSRTGGAVYFAQWAGERFVRGRRTAKLFAWVMGLVFHQGGTVSTVLTGTTSRPLGDEHDVSHEEMAYVVDSTASPAATVIPFNAWPIYVGGLVAGTIPMFESGSDGVAFFFSSLPYNFYALFAIAITLLFSLEKLPFVPGRQMRAAIDRARETGELDDPEATPLSAAELTELEIPDDYQPGLVDFVGPIGTLLGVAVVPYLVSYFYLGQTEDPTLLIAEAFGAAVLVSIAIALVKGLRLESAIEGFVDGCKGMTIGAIILALAVTLKEVATTIGTAEYVVSTVGGSLPAAILPGALLLAGVVVAFSTGTSWGTYAVLFPVAMPLAWELQADRFFLQLCFAAVVGGGVLGDQCSPISDTTILSSLATGCDLMDHVRTQIPLALVAAAGALVAYTALALTVLQ